MNTKLETHAFVMIFIRTNLRMSQSKAKNCEESAGDVRFDVAPQKPSKNVVKRAFDTKNVRKQIFRRRKTKCWGLSETCFRKVSKRTELCLRGKRSFEIFEFILSFFFRHSWYCAALLSSRMITGAPGKPTHSAPPPADF